MINAHVICKQRDPRMARSLSWHSRQLPESSWIGCQIQSICSHHTISGTGKSCSKFRVIYKKILVPITMIEHTICARSNTFLSDQNACLLSYNIIEAGIVKVMLNKDDRANKFCPILCVFARSYDRWSAL